MKIVFYCGHPYWGGLSNGGGTRTIVESCEALVKLGHEARIVAKSDKYTWTSHRPPLKAIPSNADAVVAVSVSDIKPMIQEMNNGKIKARAYWMRGFEQWQMPKEKLYKRLKNFDHNGNRIFCNSGWLSAKLWKHGIKNQVMYAGINLDSWQDMRRRPTVGTTVIGCLYNKSHATKRWDMFKALWEKLGKESYAYYGFGATKIPDKDGAFLDYYTKGPDHELLQGFYSSCNIWFAPTELEGFHNCPAEAALCGALVLHRGIPSNGVGDYANEWTSERFTTIDQAISIVKNPDYSKVQKMQQLLAQKIGTRQKNMRRLVEALR